MKKELFIGIRFRMHCICIRHILLIALQICAGHTENIVNNGKKSLARRVNLVNIFSGIWRKVFMKSHFSKLNDGVY